MPDKIEIRVYDSPAPQGSKKPFINKYTGRVQLVESSAAVKPWRESVKLAAITAMGGAGRGINGPVVVEIIFTRPKPKSAPKTRRTLPDRTPDLDKLLRSSFDALVSVGVIEDDARVVRCCAAKVFPGEDVDALEVPGAVIRISRAMECPAILDRKAGRPSGQFALALALE